MLGELCIKIGFRAASHVIGVSEAMHGSSTVTHLKFMKTFSDEAVLDVLRWKGSGRVVRVTRKLARKSLSNRTQPTSEFPNLKGKSKFIDLLSFEWLERRG